MVFSYSAVWDDTTRLLRDNGRLLAAIAGVFIFLPALLFAQFLPPPPVTNPARIWEILAEHLGRVWPWLILETLLSMVGTAAMLRLVLARGASVGVALTFGLKLLPFYFLLSLLVSIICLLAFVPVTIVAAAVGVAGLSDPTVRLLVILCFCLTLVAVFYLVGRVIPAAPIMVAENRRNPINAIARSFDITKGKGWAVFGLVLIVIVVGVIVASVATALIGLILVFAAGREIGLLLSSVVSSAFNAGFATLILMLYAAIYRALAGPDSAAAFE